MINWESSVVTVAKKLHLNTPQKLQRLYRSIAHKLLFPVSSASRRCVIFRHQLQVLMGIRLWGSSCCSLLEGRGSSSTANPSHCLTNPTCPGLDSLPRVSLSRQICIFLKISWKHVSDLVNRSSISLTFGYFKVTAWFAFFCFPGTPCYVDSEGVVRMLNRSLGNTWTPVCNTRETCKSKSDHYWVVGVHENPQQLRWAQALVLSTCRLLRCVLFETFRSCLLN